MGGRGAVSASGGSGSRSDYSKYVAEPSVYGTVTRKQGGAVFRAYKDGNLPSATKEQINMMYGRYVAGKYDARTPTTDAATLEVAGRLRTTVNATMARDYRAADTAFQDFVSSHYRKFDDKTYPDTRRKRKSR